MTNAELDIYRRRVTEAVITHKTAKKSLQQTKLELKQAIQTRDEIEQTQSIFQHVAQAVQQSVHNKIAGVVSRCLETIFDEPYEFRITFERKRGRTEAKLSFVRNGMEVDPMTASGGGVIDVAAFALRLACLILAKPQQRRLIILDEPFKYLSLEFRYRVKDLLMGLAKEMKVQFLMVTHFRELECGTVIELE